MELVRKLLDVPRRVDLTPQSREEFHRLVHEIGIEDDRKTLQRAEGRLPSALAPWLRPALWAYLRYTRGMEKQRGNAGELRVGEMLGRLGWRWIVSRSVVLRDGNSWAEVDLLAIGPGGVCPIEVKHWGHWVKPGSKQGVVWRADTRKWPKRVSPVNQASRGAAAIRRRLHAEGIEAPVMPLVIMVGTQKLERTRESAEEDLGMPIFYGHLGPRQAMEHLRSLPQALDDGTIRHIVEALRDK